MEKTYSILFKKINYDTADGYFFLKPIKVVKTEELDFNYTFVESKYTNEKTKIEESDLWISDNKKIYGYNVSREKVSETYSKIKKEYLENLLYSKACDRIYVVRYNKDDDTTKIVNIYKEDIEMGLKNLDFDDLEISYSKDLKRIECCLNEDLINKYVNLLENKKNNEVLEFFKEILLKKDDLESIEIYSLSEDDEDDFEDQEIEEVVSNTNTENSDNLNDELKKLKEMIGLANIKEKVQELITYLTFIDKIKNDAVVKNPNLHMLYTGNPGTGKTTVARIVSKILYLLGYAKSDKFAEATPKDFIAQYVGQTAPKTASFIKKNKGGVIFVDEAYDFAGKAQEFGGEALVEIIKEMEKNETIFIFVGYKNEMDSFIKSNPGLASRLGYYFEFKDYTTEELMEIFKLKLEKTKFKITTEALKKIYNIVDKVEKNKNFGNGRFIDKLFDKIIIKHAVNVNDTNDLDKLLCINEIDIDDNILTDLIYNNNQKIEMGFQYSKKRTLGGN